MPNKIMIDLFQMIPGQCMGTIWSDGILFKKFNKSSVNFGGKDILARKYTYEKLTKCLNFIRQFSQNIFRSFFFLGGGRSPSAVLTPGPKCGLRA